MYLLRMAPLLLLALPVVAQAPVRIGDLQVTATRVTAPVASVAAAVTVLDGDELRQRGVTFLLDALAQVPGAMMVQTGSYGAPASLFLRGGESDFTKVLIDGVPLNQPGGSLNLANLQLDDVERIEVVRGPVSVLYGADAVSGVIHVITRRGAGRLSAELSAEGGTFGASDLRGRLAAGTKGWHASVAGSRFASDGIYPFNNQYLNGSGGAHLGWDGGTRGAIDFTVRYSDVLGRFPTDGGGIPNDINQRALDRDLTVGAQARRRVAGVDATVESWVHRLASDYRDPQDALADTIGFGFAATRDAILERSGLQLRLDRRLMSNTTASAGIGVEAESETQHSVTTSNFGFGIDESVGDFSADRSTRFGYGQLLATVRSDFDVQVGLRHDESDAFGGFTTMRAGVVWRPVAGWRVWSAAGTAFKAPLFSELFAQSAFEVGNPALQPERSRSYEAGVEWRGTVVGIAATAYHQNYRDLIQYVSAAPGDPTYANLGAARSRGLETTLTATLTRGVTLRGRWSWLSTSVTDSGVASTSTFAQGEPLLRRPAQSGGLLLLLHQLGATGSVAVDWVGERDDVDFRDFPATRITLPSYGVVGASLTVPVLGTGRGGPGLELHLRAENLFDAAWDQVVGFEGRGRTVRVGGRLSY
jgi:vitamin B12 transporter